MESILINFHYIEQNVVLIAIQYVCHLLIISTIF